MLWLHKMYDEHDKLRMQIKTGAWKKRYCSQVTKYGVFRYIP